MIKIKENLNSQTKKIFKGNILYTQTPDKFTVIK
ncbi:MAG: hypothetical protein K0Q97_1102, partial [Bacillota bacterium]|nr:hypothetical protein [Bacillota bacterium]